MTEPLHPTVQLLPPPPPAPSTPVKFPLGWLLSNAPTPLQYRAIVEVAKLPRSAMRDIEALPYANKRALLLATLQGVDGTWNRSMLGVPTARAEHFEGIGTIAAFRRLIEYGWDRESPPLALARRVLFRLLAEDEDPALLYELAPKGSRDEEVARANRVLLREAAAAALAQAGYEGDPRLRGAARRILERVSNYLRSPVSQRPWTRVGNRQVLAAEAAPPSVFTLLMVAHMPLFQSEYHEALHRIYRHLTQPLPRQESMQLVGDKIVARPYLVLGDMLPHRNAVDADIPFALFWLEMMARLGFLRRNEGWSKMFERFVDDRDREGVWHPHKGLATPRSTNPFMWPVFPLDDAHEENSRWTDVTFRVGLIAKLSGRPIDLV